MSSRPDAERLVWPYIRAEFLKIYAFRIPQISYLLIFFATFLFAFQLYHYEELGKRLAPKNAFDVMPVLVFATWKSLLFQVLVIGFSVFCVLIESQYGMVRVVCTQPLSREEYILGKCAAVFSHVFLLAMAYVFSLLTWTSVYSGLSGLDVHEVLGLTRFAVYTVAFSLSLSGIAIAAALLRRTIASGLIAAFALCTGLGFMTTFTGSPSFNRFIFLKYFFFLLQPFRPWASWANSYFVPRPDADFALVMVLTPLLVAIPAIIYFKRRDISE
jgi:ABC-2 family transporter protein